MDRRNHVSGQTGTTGSSPVLTTNGINCGSLIGESLPNVYWD